MRIKRYHLASGSNAQTLQDEVGKLLGDGWQPYGQLIVKEQSPDSADRFFQPMVQYEGEIRS